MRPMNTSSRYRPVGTTTAVSAPRIEINNAPAKMLPNNRKPNDRIFANSETSSRIPTPKSITPNIGTENIVLVLMNLPKYDLPSAHTTKTWINRTAATASAKVKLRSVGAPRKNGTTSHDVQSAPPSGAWPSVDSPDAAASPSAAAASATGFPASMVYNGRLPIWNNSFGS